MRNLCKTTIITIDTIKMLFQSTLLEKKLKTSDSCSMKKIDRIMNTKQKLDLSEIKSVEESKNAWLFKEKLESRVIKLTVSGKMLIIFSMNLLRIERRKLETKMKSID